MDTHINRVTKRLGLANDKASPADIKITLESSLPLKDYSYADGAILSIGKEYCKTGRPRCGECPLEQVCEKCGV